MVEYVYDAWGNFEICGEDEDLGNINPFRYRGYYYDNETGLYYLQTRYYDPEVGRFLNMDSLDYADPDSINGLNLYAYCGNNPVMYVDPTGHTIISFLVGLCIAMATWALTNTATQLCGDVINYAMTGDWDLGWEEYASAFLGGLAGGATFFLSHGNLSATFAVMGGAETLFDLYLRNVSGKGNYSDAEIVGRTLLSIGIGYASGKIFGGTKINKLTKGSNSYLSIWKTGLTKLYNGTTSRMSSKVILKGLIGVSTLRIGAAIIQGLFSVIIEWLNSF